MKPLHHVSGFMAWMRCVLTGGEYRHLNWKAVEQGAPPELPARPEGWVISLVPTQLERLLRQPAATAWLAGFRMVFLGGAPAPAGLLDRAAAARIPLSPGYGLTEMAAMVSGLRPEEFLAGARNSGKALPHAQVSVTADGVLTVDGGSLFRGYYPAWRGAAALETGDLGRIDGEGHLHVAGRRDAIIITGGEKVNPAEVEAVLRDQGGLSDVVVLGLPDAEWGQIVVAAYPSSNRPDPVKIQQLVAQLAPAKRPKHFVPLQPWPRTGAGKVNRAEVARLAGASLH
jgi:O-succinylbenzoic acid--CoA ligase